MLLKIMLLRATHTAIPVLNFRRVEGVGKQAARKVNSTEVHLEQKRNISDKSRAWNIFSLCCLFDGDNVALRSLCNVCASFRDPVFEGFRSLGG